MKTKEEIIKTIIHRFIMEDDDSKLKQILEEELPTLNPNRIDEKRMEKIFGELKPNAIYSCRQGESDVAECVQRYNSTIPVSKELEPLPKEMPEDLGHVLNEYWKRDTQVFEENVWNYITSKYGTPKREWWMDCDKFIYGGKEYQMRGYEVLRNGSITLYGHDWFKFPLSQCTPYIEPTTKEKLLAKLDEEGKELLAKWEAER